MRHAMQKTNLPPMQGANHERCHSFHIGVMPVAELFLPLLLTATGFQGSVLWIILQMLEETIFGVECLVTAAALVLNGALCLLCLLSRLLCSFLRCFAH